MWAGCYSLDLYCDNSGPNLKGMPHDGIHSWDEFPHNYTDELGSVCRAKARKNGWIIGSDSTAICPKCNPKSKRYVPRPSAAP